MRWMRRSDLVDWVLAVTVAAVALLLQWQGCRCRTDPAWLDVAVTLLATLPIGLRRRLPFLVLLVCGTASMAHLVLGFTNQFPMTFAVLVALFSVANYEPWSLSALSAAVTAALLPLSFLVDWTNQGHVQLSDIPYNYALAGAAWILGDNLRQRRRRERELEDRAERLTAEQDRRAREAVADERTRIARDLHDVVAHMLSVIVLQAGAGRRIAAAQPERAREVLAAIETQGREAMTDMRRLVTILRTDRDRAPGTEPQPSLERLEALVEGVRTAGLAVELKTEGEPGPLPPAVDLSAYRIVQEALTNALRHAHAGHATVVVRYGSAAVEVEILDDGRGATANGSAPGHGLIGMQERVSMFGGELETGSPPAGGFRVRALLPLDGGLG